MFGFLIGHQMPRRNAITYLPMGLILKYLKKCGTVYIESPLEEDVINGLKLIVPEIQRVGLIKEKESVHFYVPPSGLNLKIFKDWWNHLCLSTFEDDVINGLKLIIPDIQRIGLKEEYVKFVDEIQRKLSSILKAKIEGLDFAVPLESFGGGVLRDFGIILSKDGVLLIDEFENGLHYSVQPEIWKLILTLAKRLNVQVFATTHSWDCIEAFKEATGECKEDISCQLIRLSKKNGKFLIDDLLTRMNCQWLRGKKLRCADMCNGMPGCL